ncbi:MAG: hypothetical protein NTV21_11200 [Planctomycetota bacterium]|nr:hypothetical protein [Planctomycetota bacterium]
MYSDRGAWGDAIKSYRVAASDASARDVVKAAAKHLLAHALLMGGAEDPTRFTEAANEAQEFLASYATSLDVPQVRMLHARALWLAGKPAEAGAGPLAAGAAAEDANKPLLQAISDEAALGAGYVDLAAGQSKQALTFFSARFNQLRGDTPSSARFAILLGYGEALLAEGKAREAALQLAKVVGLDADRDRALRATVKMAEAYTKLSDADSRAQACARIKDVLTNGGDSPAAVRARQLAKELGC